MPNKNVIIAQSGGPTAVINNTLRGIIETCKMFPDKFGNIYGGYHGVEGILKEELINISAQSDDEIQLLRTTPASGSIGTCRYKLKENQQEDFIRIIEVFKTHKIGYFFYIGGNDSMDTAHKVAKLAHDRDLDVTVVGIAKTIDNDLGDSQFKLIDHTPGYGSIARYWAYYIQNVNEENLGSSPSDPVMVIQVMGRKIGFIAASARLADPDKMLPLQIYMPESGLSIDDATDTINDGLNKNGRVIVVISEGFDVGSVENVKDSFGHTQYGSSAMSTQQLLVNHLNTVGINAHGSARGQIPGTDQRNSMIYASTIDLDESYKIGQNAVVIAVNHGTGFMSTILRKKGLNYDVYYDRVLLETVANSERQFPEHWITSNRIDVTDDFFKYALPLIGEDWVSIPLIKGVQRFTRFEKIFADQKLPQYTPQAYRH
jgi:6-phosphofructokinase